MAVGAIFNLISNEGKQDKLFTQIFTLRARIVTILKTLAALKNSGKEPSCVKDGNANLLFST